MKLRSLLRQALVGLAILATLGSAAAQSAPRVQIALVLDQSGPSGSTGVVHRIDTRTGKYLGLFGSGSLFGPSAIAVQPATNVVFVDDSTAIKKLDMSTGRYLGLFTRNTALGGTVVSMRFAPSGDLYAAIRTDATHYKPVRIDPATGAVTGVGSAQSCNFHTKTSVGFRPDGRVEVLNSLAGYTYADTYSADLAVYDVSSRYLAVEDTSDYRTSNDVFIRRVTNGGVYGGIGAFGVGSQVGQNNLTLPLFCEAPLNQTVSFGLFGGSPTLVFLDTNELPFTAGAFATATFTHGTLVDMAIYAK